METLVTALVDGLRRTTLVTGCLAVGLQRSVSGFELELGDGETLEADGVVIAAPAYAAASLLDEIDADLAAAHAEIPYSSTAVVTLAFGREEVGHPLDGYGYVVPRIEGSDVLACTWTSSKWEGRAPENQALVRVYAGRSGGRDVTADSDDDLVELAREEIRLLETDAEPRLVRIHRWPQGMPQYVLGHPERVAGIESALTRHPGLAVAGAAYHGVGIPDCIRSGEEAARSIARALVPEPARTTFGAK
jgi:oxygen-dependent protoporphyrinogen oxidase